MEALAEHHKKAYDELDPEHIRIEESIKAAFAYVQRKSEISGRRHKVSDVEFSDSGNLIHRVGIGKHKTKYFWDYNTVERFYSRVQYWYAFLVSCSRVIDSKMTNLGNSLGSVS